MIPEYDGWMVATYIPAVAGARWLGKGDKLAADAAAVDAMRHCLTGVEFSGRVVIGEGEKDDAPMLHNGEIVGTGVKPRVDIAVDPLDGTCLVAGGDSPRSSLTRAVEASSPHSLYSFDFR